MRLNTYGAEEIDPTTGLDVGDAEEISSSLDIGDAQEDTSPVASIYKTAYSRGVNPDFLVGLAKLETRMGEATIKGDSDSYNLFNIKDFSGKGPRATDEAEGSRDAYRQYASYDESTNDLVDLLERKYPKALEAQTPEQFATALKQGGYATDPDYVNKIVRTINSVRRDAQPSQPSTEDAGMPNHINLRALDAQMEARSAQPEPQKKAPSTERTWREALTDTGRSLGQGIIDVAGVMPGVAYGAATGNYDNAWLNTARGMNEIIQMDKSEGIKARQAEMDKKLSNAEGFTEKIVAGFVEGLADPTLLADTLARSVPGMVAGGGLGRVAGTAADALGMTALKTAAAQPGIISQGLTVASAAPRVAGATAVGTSALVQGSSVASDTYEEAMKQPIENFRAIPEFAQLAQEHGEEQAKSILAGQAATRAGMAATAASLVAQKALPGGASIEKMFLPSTMREVADTVVKTGSSVLTKPLTKGMAGGVASQAAELGLQGVKVGMKEGVSEGLEETFGKVEQELEMSRLGKDVNLADTAASTFGQAAAAGVAMGHVAGMRETAATKAEAIAAEGARLREMAAQRQADITKAGSVDEAIKAATDAQDFTSQSIANQILQLEHQETTKRPAPVEELPQATTQPQPTNLGTAPTPEAVQPGPTFDASTLPILQQESTPNGTKADQAIQSKPQEALAETILNADTAALEQQQQAKAQAQAAQDAGIRSEVARMREIMDARRQAEQQAALEAMPNTSPAKQVTATSGTPVVEAPVKDLKLSADVPQFKSDAGANGVVDKLEGKYDRALAAPIQVWQRTDGSMEVVSGRHRLDLAQRSGEQTVPVQIHREADGFTAQHATLLDTELNVKDGRGKVKDYVRYFQSIPVERSEATQRGLLQTAIGRDAYTIANAGSDELIASHNASQLTDQAATQIAQAAPKNGALQAVGMRMVADGKSITQAVNTMAAVKLMQQERGGDTTGDLFGFDDSSMRDAQAMAKIAGQEQAKVNNTLAAVRGASKRPELAAKEGVNINDQAALSTRIQALEQQKTAWSNWATNPELVAQIRSKMEPQNQQQTTPPSSGVSVSEVVEPAAKVVQNENQNFTLTSPTRSDVLAQQAAIEAEEARKEQGGDKPITRKVTADQVDLFNPQGGLFDAPTQELTIEAAHAHIDSDATLNTLEKAKARAALRKGDIEPVDILPKVQETAPAQAATESAPQNENFKRWFDGSKVVDADGKPLAMYHGTNKTANGEAISVFDTYGSNYGLFGQGQYFTDNPDVAASYTKKGKGESPTVYKVNLAIKNPIDMDAHADPAAWGNAFPDVDFSEATSTNGKQASNEAMYRAVEDHYTDQRLPKYEVAEAIQDGLRGMGHDGITHIGGGRFGKKGDETRHRVYIAFEPEQIKSATGNNGEYNPSNPDISRSTTASTPTEQTLTTRQTVRDAIAESLPKQARAIDRMIQRGDEGKRGGLVVIESNTPEAIAKAYSEKTGRDYDAALASIRQSIRGKNEDMANQDDVVGNQGGRSADDSTPGVTLYHGSPESGLTSVHDRGSSLFGGVFASATERSAQSHGDNIYKTELPESDILSQSKLDYDIPQEDIKSAIEKSMPRLSEDDFDIAYQAVIEDQAHRIDDDDLMRVFGEDDVGAALWEAQRIRGKVARLLGFKAVEMNDEHGTSYLLLPGVALNDNSAPNIDGAQLRLSKDGKIQGFHDPQSGLSFVVASNVTKGTAAAVALHEAYHGQQRDAIDTKAQALLDSADDKLHTKATREVLLEARQKITDASETGNKKEAAAYIIEAAAQRGREAGFSAVDGKFMDWVDKHIGVRVGGIIRDFVSMVRAHSLRIGLPINLHVDDLVAYAKLGLERAAEGKTVAGDEVMRSEKDTSVFGTTGFSKWFGDSKVTDADGNPMVMYHGTKSDFSQFDIGKFGATDGGFLGKAFYFSPDPAEASVYAESVTSPYGTSSGANVMPVYLSAKNPLEWELGTKESSLLAEKRRELGADGFVQWAQDQGYDSVHLTSKAIGNMPGENQWAVFSPKQIKSATGNNGDFDGKNPDIRFSRSGGNNTTPPQQQPAAPQPTWDYQGSKADKLIYEMQDGRIDLKRVQEAIKRSGQDINEKFDARLAETLYAGRVAKRTDKFLQDDAAPLLEQMARTKVTTDELSDYLLARHAPERNAQIAKVNDDMPDGGAGKNSKGVLMTTQAAQDYIANLPTETRLKMEALAQKVDAITKGTRDLLVSEGLEKQETIDAWNAAYKHYAPLFREDVDDGRPHSVGTGFSVRGDASKRATGSDKKVDNMLAHVLMQREAAITRAEKNRVAMSLYGLALSSPNKGFWTTITPTTKKAQIMSELVAMGVDPVVAEQGMEGIPTTRTVDKVTGKVVDRINPLYKSLSGAITVRVNGEDRVLMLNQKDPNALRLAENLKNLDGLTKFDLASNIIGKSTRWISASNTQYNPAFGLVNSTRDSLGALVNLSTTPLAGKQLQVFGNMGRATQGIYSALRGDTSGQWAQLYEQFQMDGGQTGYKEMFKDVDARAKAIEKQLTNYDKSAISPGKAAHAVLSVLDGFNTIGENVVRLSAYKAALDNGMSRPEAAKLARELTVDFNRKGRMGRELGPLYAFFNASVQGTARTLASLKGPAGAKIIAGGIGLGMLQAAMLAAAGYDDDEIPDFVKSRNLVVPLGKTAEGEKKYFLIPMHLGLHVLPNIGRTIAELGRSGGKDFGKKTVGAIAEVIGALNPIGGGTVYTPEKGVDWGGVIKTATPTILDPVVELATNKGFSGQAIEKTYRDEADNRPGFQRAKEKTQRTPTGQMYLGITKALNRLTGGSDYEAGFVSPSPEKARYLAEAIGGGLLREIEKAVDLSVKVPGQKEAKPSGVPFIGRFYGETDSDAVTQQRYYKSMDKVKSVKSSIDLAKAAGDRSAVERIYKTQPEAKLIDLGNRVQSHLSKLNKLAVSQINNPEKVKAVDEARLKLMRATNQKILEMEAQ